LADLSFDHLVGGHEQFRRDGEAERLRHLKIDGQFEFGRLEDGNIGRFPAFQDLVDDVGDAPA